MNRIFIVVALVTNVGLINAQLVVGQTRIDIALDKSNDNTLSIQLRGLDMKSAEAVNSLCFTIRCDAPEEVRLGEPSQTSISGLSLYGWHRGADGTPHFTYVCTGWGNRSTRARSQWTYNMEDSVFVASIPIIGDGYCAQYSLVQDTCSSSGSHDYYLAIDGQDYTGKVGDSGSATPVPCTHLSGIDRRGEYEEVQKSGFRAALFPNPAIENFVDLALTGDELEGDDRISIGIFTPGGTQIGGWGLWASTGSTLSARLQVPHSCTGLFVVRVLLKNRVINLPVVFQ